MLFIILVFGLLLVILPILALVFQVIKGKDFITSADERIDRTEKLSLLNTSIITIILSILILYIGGWFIESVMAVIFILLVLYELIGTLLNCTRLLKVYETILYFRLVSVYYIAYGIVTILFILRYYNII